MVNENDITFLKHFKNEECVIIQSHGQSNRIYDVEKVRYTNKEENITDEGSLVESLNKWLERGREDRRNLVALIQKLEKGCSDIASDIDSAAYGLDKELKDRLHEISAKAYELSNTELRKTEEVEKIPNEVMPYIDSLKDRIDELEQLVEDTKKFEEAYKSANDRIMRRSLWQRIKNEKV